MTRRSTDLVDYYSAVASVMLPHLKDRPLTLQRFPRGIDEKGFIQQDFADTMPDWMSRAEVGSQDVMRNAYAQTAVAPYAVRARVRAPVATPLDWTELDDRALRSDRYTLRDIAKRLAGHADLWADLSRHARSLTRPRRRLTRLRPAST